VAKPSFINLWNAYAKLCAEHPKGKPCDGPWDNQCAIRMSIVINAERTIKINKSTYSEPKCAHEHARGAESLANWLWKRTQIGPPTIYGNSAADRAKLLTKTGIIFYKDFYRQPNDAPDRPTGDHIDLWDRGTTYTGDYFYDAKAIWFWELS